MRASVALRDSVWATNRRYDYLVPENLENMLCVGHLVRVPFGKGNVTSVGLVLAVMPDADSPYALKVISSLVDDKPMIDPRDIKLIDYLRFRYTCSYGDALRLMVPAAVAQPPDKRWQIARLTDPQTAIDLLNEHALDSVAQIRVMDMLLEYIEAPVSEIMQALSISRSPLQTLQKKGLIAIEKAVAPKDIKPPITDDSTIRGDMTEPPKPSAYQADAIKKIDKASGFSQFLLYGITGSGKTEVYLRCAQTRIDCHQGVLLLVPEIALTPQMVQWINARFPKQAAVLHSRLTPKERYEQWKAIRDGQANIVVGARSAAFAPIKNLGLIIVDEEHDTSYKSEMHPRYHVKDIVRQRALAYQATVVFGSATPSIETFFAAKNGYLTLLPLPQRVRQMTLPDVTIVDMREELRHKNRSIFSRDLTNAIFSAIEKDEQIILFLNRRGYASMMLCRACGKVTTCPHCSVGMTIHTATRSRSPALICHYCGYVKKTPDACEACGSTLQGRFGMGTQQLEKMLETTFPGEKVIRMDRDTTVGKDAHGRLLQAFRDGEARFLIGTQMIAKGHDFPNVTVVGIVAADLLCRSNDFRSGERAFALMTQASGRAGREKKKGHVFIQTYQPDDPAIRFAADQDYDRFYESEIAFRQRMNYPPFCAFGSLIVSDRNEQRTRTHAEELKKAILDFEKSLGQPGQIDVFGPFPHAIYRVREQYRQRINIKADCKSHLSKIFFALQQQFYGQDMVFQMDLDPLW